MFLRILALGLAMSLAIFSTDTATAGSSCEITSCRSGGSVPGCLAKIRKEHATKRKTCGRVQIGSGISAYAMATGLPGVCIKHGARIGIHRPYRHSLKEVAIGSYYHNYYFGHIRPQSVAYFKAKGGMKRTGFGNAASMIYVPASQTGLPPC
jgi:hypothetical protein